MLRLRIVTAVVLAAVFFATLFAQQPAVFIGLCVLMVLTAAWEWSALAGIHRMSLRGAYVIVVSLLMALTLQLVFPDAVTRDFWLPTLLYGAGVFWIGVLLMLLTYPASTTLWSSRFARVLLGIATLIAAWVALLYLRYHNYGQFWVIYVVAIVASADIGAYFVGRAFGSKKLAAVSPGKSWEGFWGGIAVSLLVATGIYYVYFPAKVSNVPPLLGFMLVTALLAATSVLGDLFESMLKRYSGIKDSGSILPGHGGVMDRIDGLVAALPVCALVTMSFGW